MKITFEELAEVLQSIRDTAAFDGKDNIHEFMDHLEAYGDLELSLERVCGVMVYNFEGLDDPEEFEE